MVLPNHIREAEINGMPEHEPKIRFCRQCDAKRKGDDIDKCDNCGRECCPKCWYYIPDIALKFCCKECAITRLLKLLAAAEMNDKPITEHPDVQRLVGQVVELQKNLEVWREACGNNEKRIEELQAEKGAIKTQYTKDLVATKKFYFPKPVCQNQPPEITEITNGYNACLSCPMRKTCLLIFKKP